jgi:4-amino-4-deoxy-L-arabinose transferase-like glycosyltransferase
MTWWSGNGLIPGIFAAFPGGMPPVRQHTAPAAGADAMQPARRAGNFWPAERHAFWLLVFVTALTVFRLAALALSRTDLFFDEAQYWFWSRELSFGYYSKPPLIAWIIRGATAVCGMSEACIRAPSPLIHAATAMVIYAIGRALYDARIGFWSGLVYATLPGVSFSSGIISTDVPLLLCVAVALLALIKMRMSPSWGWAVVLGLAIGFGLNGKYAMSYFLLCLGIYALAAPAGRALLRDPRLYAALAIAAVLIAPNIGWNAQHKFATFAHTADNANWGGSLFHPADALEFFFGQFGVFGPILFTCLIIFVLNWRRPEPATGDVGAERLLLGFCVPVLGLMLVQALLSRAHANWAAFAYIAATVLITAALLRTQWTGLFRVSLWLHLAIALLMGLGGMLAGRLGLPAGADPYARVLGWRAMAEAAGDKAEAEGYRAIVTDKRAFAAELHYYLRDRHIPVVALRGEGPPRDHFELTRPLDDKTPRPVLMVSQSRGRTGDVEPVGAADIMAGSERRTITFYRLKDAKP